MSRITEGHLARHYQGVKGGRDAALLDIAQDLIHQAGLFERGLVFKGGTALRKFRAGNAGRFSTDLDFAAPEEELALSVLQALDGVEIEGFEFAVENLGDDGRRGDLRVETPFGRPLLGAKVELARHQLSLDPDLLAPVPLPIHDRYDFALAPTPVVRIEEAISEKLARYRRVSLARDLYDLHWFATAGSLAEVLTRRLWVLKTFRDVVVDGRGSPPIDAVDVLRPRTTTSFRTEDIGYLRTPVRIDEWIATVRTRYAFLAHLEPDERRGFGGCTNGAAGEGGRSLMGQDSTGRFSKARGRASATVTIRDGPSGCRHRRSRTSPSARARSCHTVGLVAQASRMASPGSARARRVSLVWLGGGLARATGCGLGGAAWWRGDGTFEHRGDEVDGR